MHTHYKKLWDLLGIREILGELSIIGTNRNFKYLCCLIYCYFGTKTVLICDTRSKAEVGYRIGYLYEIDVSSSNDCRTTPISNNPPVWVRTGRVRIATCELDC